MVLCLVFLNLKTPRASFRDRFRRIDWMCVPRAYMVADTKSHMLDSGNILIIGSTTSALLALTWGGIQFSWTSAHVLAPLIIGIVGIFAWVLYEITVPLEPTIPFRLLSNRTTVSGYIGTALQGFIIAAALCESASSASFSSVSQVGSLPPCIFSGM